MARSSGSSFRRSFSASVSTTSAAASSPARPHGHPPSAPAAPGYPPSTRPSPEYLQHFDVVAPEISTRILRPGWLHRTRLLQLRETDLIDEATLDTALTWRRDHDRAHASDALTSGFTPKIDSSRTGSPVLRLDALRRLREAAAALGPWRTLLLERLVVHDDSWPALGRLLRCSDKTARIRLAEVLAALLEHQSGRSVPPETLTKSYHRI